ncbi:MAG TPA: cytochrome d ubiquinol oxidase subunit II [Streptosporangiaceae bacterium]|nr:cytochrome d ubiquinol oxidase subunit II [Streptosporangiaceae bacterium]
MHLSDLWFIAIAVLWAGYFVLEGFDFGVGILLPALGRDQARRRIMINTIGPTWDGNEVWLLTAGGATFAAFPGWYASMFSAFYLPLLLILVALIIRGVAFEYRGKRASAAWRRRWDTAIFAGSLLPAILWGVAFGNVLHGIPLNAAHNYAGNFFTMLNPYSLVGGLATLTLFVLDGALFLALKTMGDLRREAMTTARLSGAAAVVAGGGFLAWTEFSYRTPGHVATGVASVILAFVAAVALLIALAAATGWGLNGRRDEPREGVAFGAAAVGIAAATGALFTALYPNVLPSTINTAYTLTTGNASSTAKTLAVMTVVACIFLPFVLLYQGWTYWVFRKRLGAPPQPAPAVEPQPPQAPEPQPPQAPGSQRPTAVS